jgi:hypothetical protein
VTTPTDPNAAEGEVKAMRAAAGQRAAVAEQMRVNDDEGSRAWMLRPE